MATTYIPVPYEPNPLVLIDSFVYPGGGVWVHGHVNFLDREAMSALRDALDERLS